MDYERDYVSWATWKGWKEHPENKALMDKVPKALTIVTVCEWGIPASDVETWIAYATGERTMHEID